MKANTTLFVANLELYIEPFIHTRSTIDQTNNRLNSVYQYANRQSSSFSRVVINGNINFNGCEDKLHTLE